MIYEKFIDSFGDRVEVGDVGEKIYIQGGVKEADDEEEHLFYVSFDLDTARAAVVAISNAIAHAEANKTRRLSRESQCPAI